VINGSYSGWNDVLSGIPQGSVLGPLPFTIYINDLPSVLKNSVLVFADDAKVFTTIDCLNPSSTLQDDISGYVRWAMEWKLPFNVSISVKFYIWAISFPCFPTPWMVTY